MTLKEVVVKVVVSVASLLLVAMRDPDHQALLYGAVPISKVTGDVGKIDEAVIGNLPTKIYFKETQQMKRRLHGLDHVYSLSISKIHCDTRFHGASLRLALTLWSAYSVQPAKVSQSKVSSCVCCIMVHTRSLVDS